MSSVLGTDVVVQLGLVVENLDETGQKFADFFGVPCPTTVYSGEPAVVQGSYLGKPTEASCHMKFFETPSLQLELIQPDDNPSVWRDFLNEKGEGLHHIAFRVKDMEQTISGLETNGHSLLQRGLYGDASGQFAYMDTRKDLKLILELLEDFDQ